MEDDYDKMKMTASRNAFLSGALLVEILTGRSSNVSSEVTIKLWGEDGAYFATDVKFRMMHTSLFFYISMFHLTCIRCCNSTNLQIQMNNNCFTLIY